MPVPPNDSDRADSLPQPHPRQNELTIPDAGIDIMLEVLRNAQ